MAAKSSALRAPLRGWHFCSVFHRHAWLWVSALCSACPWTVCPSVEFPGVQRGLSAGMAPEGTGGSLRGRDGSAGTGGSQEQKALQGQEGQGHCRDRRVTPRGSAGTAGSHPGALLQPPLDFPPEEAWQGSELLSDTFNSSAANAAASSLPQQGDFWGEVCGAAERKTSCDVRKAAWKRKKKKKKFFGFFR